MNYFGHKHLRIKECGQSVDHMMELIDEICDLLQGHANRDKVVSLTSYTLKLWGSTAKSQTLMTASARLAATRATLRLFDDAAALRTFLAYGLGKHEGPIWGTLGVSGGVFTLAYLQAEKLVWLLDTGVLVLPETQVWNIRTAHKLFWSLSAFVGFIRSIRALHVAARNVKDPERTKCAPARFTQATLTSTKLLLDLVHAVSWLPQGWLWGNRLPTPQAAGIATASAVLGLVMHYHGKRLLPR